MFYRALEEKTCLFLASERTSQSHFSMEVSEFENSHLKEDKNKQYTCGRESAQMMGSSQVYLQI